MATEEFLDEALWKLLSELKTVEAQLEKYFGPDVLGEENEGGVYNIKAVAKQNRQSLREKQGDIIAALKRIEGGTFGVCIDCGKQIPKDRLRVAYYVKRCAPCQSKKERVHPRKYW